MQARQRRDTAHCLRVDRSHDQLEEPMPNADAMLAMTLARSSPARISSSPGSRRTALQTVQTSISTPLKWVVFIGWPHFPQCMWWRLLRASAEACASSSARIAASRALFSASILAKYSSSFVAMISPERPDDSSVERPGSSYSILLIRARSSGASGPFGAKLSAASYSAFAFVEFPSSS